MEEIKSLLQEDPPLVGKEGELELHSDFEIYKENIEDFYDELRTNREGKNFGLYCRKLFQFKFELKLDITTRRKIKVVLLKL